MRTANRRSADTSVRCTTAGGHLRGSMADAEVVAVPVRWSGMEAVHMILRDVTERRRAEKALKASEKKFRSFVENVFDAVYQSTPNGDLLLVNSAMVRMFGYDSEEELLR